MAKLPNALLLAVLLAALTVLSFGCSSALGIWPVTQSRYTSQDVAIIPVGPTSGSASDWFFTFGGMVDLMDPDIPQQAVLEAVHKKKADLLINYTLSLRATRLGIPLIESLTFWWLTWTAEGTAAKIEFVSPVPAIPEADKPPPS